jgi:hypothetical protein
LKLGLVIGAGGRSDTLYPSELGKVVDAVGAQPFDKLVRGRLHVT